MTGSAPYTDNTRWWPGKDDVPTGGERVVVGGVEYWRARAEAAEAEVERLRAKLAAAREARTAWAVALQRGRSAADHIIALDRALADEAEAGYRQARGALGLDAAVPAVLPIHVHRRPDDLEARLVRLADEYAPESALSLYRGVAGTWTLEVCEWLGTELAGRERHVAGMASPSAAVAALEAQLEADRG